MKHLIWQFNNSQSEYVELEQYHGLHVVKLISREPLLGYGKYSIGQIGDFGSFYGYPVSQSCLKKKEAIDLLKRFIELDKKYIDILPSKKESIKAYKKFIQAIKKDNYYNREYPRS